MFCQCQCIGKSRAFLERRACVSLLVAAACVAFQVPGARLALVGDGPQRQELEQHFKGMPVKFMVGVPTS